MSNFPPPPGPPFDPSQSGTPQGNNENPTGDFSTPPPVPPSPFAPPGNNMPPPPVDPYAPPGNMPPPPINPQGGNMNMPPQNPYSPPPQNPQGGNMNPPPQNPYNQPPQNPYGNVPPQNPYGNMPPQNPYGNSGQFPPPNNPYGGGPLPQFPMQRQLPNSTGVLVLGICSIVGCFCYGLPGLICGIIALILAAGAKKLYEQSPIEFTESSVKNMNAGRVCAIIGTILSAIGLIFMIIALMSPRTYNSYWDPYY